ncbi:NUDIX domain-containing protein [Kribbella voronezhensis]|uniref:NUDIX domain-containing protein n=1 Tax=Kribbella voronezhensis TaxID=2512212 RepID=A0A4R7T6U5_9ACTN|nr:NUDIX domain-containing protein [Kribbella voronezhensis]TDU86818.1 NUDIX domain-containing protein [Kribbella voronezhensis]
MYLGKFVHDSGLDLTAPTLERVAVRGVLFRGSQLLLLRSRHGDYKFPGGGVESGETMTSALQREFVEECGLREVEVGLALGLTVEYLRAAEPEYEVFKMTSHYFYCSAGVAGAAQELEGYERELELTPEWISVADGLAANRAVAESGIGVQRWLPRETQVLAHLSSDPVA